MKQKQIIFGIVIILLLIGAVKTQIEFTKLNKQNQILQNKAKEKSSIEVIQEDIKKTTNEVKVLSDTIEGLKKDYEKKVWAKRCLETLGELELKSMSGKLDCTKDLNRFSAENFDKTRFDMGL